MFYLMHDVSINVRLEITHSCEHNNNTHGQVDHP